jgi:hypothetical protein
MAEGEMKIKEAEREKENAHTHMYTLKTAHSLADAQTHRHSTS